MHAVIDIHWPNGVSKPQPATRFSVIPPSDNRARLLRYAQSQGEQMKKALANCIELRLSS